MSDEEQEPQRLYRKAALIAVAVATTTAASGFFMGLLQTDEYSKRVRREVQLPELGPTETIQEAGQIPVAPDYASIGKAGLGPNAGWENSVRSLPAPEPVPSDFKPPADKAGALAARAERRAYDGAPPVIPHQIDQRSSASCVACHGQPTKIGDLIAPVMSHESFASCTQCHAPREFPQQVSFRTATFADISSRFEGREAPEHGTRLFPGSPPTIPHTTFMRSDCRSCHGVAGPLVLRSTHTERQSCMQCHAPNAERELRDFLSRSAPSDHE